MSFNCLFLFASDQDKLLVLVSVLLCLSLLPSTAFLLLFPLISPLSYICLHELFRVINLFSLSSIYNFRTLILFPSESDLSMSWLFPLCTSAAGARLFNLFYFHPVTVHYVHFSKYPVL